MRLVQKSLLHTGYFITKDGEMIPSFTDNLLNEAMLRPDSKKICKMYGVLRKDEIRYLCAEIQKFKKEHGIIPQNLVEALRTGFGTNGELKQSHNLFIYK